MHPTSPLTLRHSPLVQPATLRQGPDCHQCGSYLLGTSPTASSAISWAQDKDETWDPFYSMWVM